MAFPQIETGYKPEFGLGALYQGFNAANADQMSEQDILKAFLANQREQQQQPLDTLIKQWDAAHAQDKLNSPEYRNAMLQGYMGQMNSQIAAGKKAMGTVDSEIPAVNQENANRLFMGKTLADWNKLRLGNPSNQMGFPMQQLPQGEAEQSISQRPNNQWGGEGLKQIRTLLESGNKGDYNKDGTPLTSPKGALFKNQVIPSTANKPGFGIQPAQSQTPEEYNRVGDEYLQKLSNIYKDPLKTLAAYNMGPGAFQKILNTYGDNWQDYLPQETKNYIKRAKEYGPSLSENILSAFNPGNKLSQLQDILVNTPEQLQHMARIQEQGKNAMGVADTRGQYLVQAALARLQKQGEKPLTIDQTVARAGRIIAGDEEGDKQAAAIVIQELGNYGLRKNPITWQEDKLNIPNTAASGAPINSPSVAQKAGIVPAPGYSPGFANMVNGSNKNPRGSTTSGNKFIIEKTP